MNKKMGITLGTYDGGCAAVIEQAKLAEQLGYSALWFGDTGYPDPLTLAGQVIAATHSAEIGIAVVPAYTRTVPVLASSAATLNDLSQGRFILGLGSSSQTMIEGWHGLPFEKPLARIRESVALLRQIFAGKKTAFDGQTIASHGFRQPATGHPQRIYLAALRPKMLELAGEIADGVILNLYPQEALPKIIEHLRIGAERGGRDFASFDVVTRIQVAVTDDPSDEIDLFRMMYAPYFATPVYNKYLDWTGHADTARDIREGWQDKDRQRTTGALTDDLIQSIAVTGTLDSCHARIRADFDAGVSTAMITTVSPHAAVREKTLHAFGASQFELPDD